MKSVSSMVFLTDATGSVESNPYINMRADVGTIQISGDMAGGTISVQAVVDTVNGQWENIAVVNTKNYKSTETIDETGIYEFGVEGIARVRVIAVGVGLVSAFARFSTTGV